MPMEISADVRRVARERAARILGVSVSGLPDFPTLRELFDTVYRLQGTAQSAYTSLAFLASQGQASPKDVHNWEIARGTYYEMQLRFYAAFVHPLRYASTFAPPALQAVANEILAVWPHPRVLPPINPAPVPQEPQLRGLGSIGVIIAVAIFLKLLTIAAIVGVIYGITQLVTSVIVAKHHMEKVERNSVRRADHFRECVAAGGTRVECRQEAEALYPEPEPPPPLGPTTGEEAKNLGFYLAVGAGLLAAGLVLTTGLRQ